MKSRALGSRSRLTELDVDCIEPDLVGHATEISTWERALQCTLELLETSALSTSEKNTCDVVPEQHISHYPWTKFVKLRFQVAGSRCQRANFRDEGHVVTPFDTKVDTAIVV